MRKYSYDETFFEKIDTEEKAYWLGFICADGYLNKKKNTLGISLDIKDIQHLEKFKNSIKSTSHIFTRKSRYSHNHKETEKCVIEIYSSKLDKDLRKLGLSETKSTSLKEVLGVPDSLFNHFVRGVYDGDGCVFNYLINNKYNNPGFTIVGTKEFLDFLQVKLPIKVKLNQDKRVANNYTYFIKSKKRFNIMYNYLYYNATLYLERKYNKCQEIITIIKESSETKEATS